MEKITKYAPGLLIVLSAFLLVQTVNAIKEYRYIGGKGVPENVISVSGEGEVFAAPDIATFTFSVVEEGKNVKDAQAKVTQKMDAILASIKKLGIEDKDVKTVDFSAYPKYEYNQIACITTPCPPGKQVLVGYEINQTISVKVRKIDDAGKAIDATTSAGASNVGALSFTIDDQDALKREARQKAITDAKGKADALAKDLGVRLVRIVNFSENGNGGFYPVMYKADMAMGRGGAVAESAPTLPTGENKIMSSVSITYEIQ